MSDITREEIEARIELSQSRIETRIAALSGDIARLIDRSDASEKRIETLVGKLEADVKSAVDLQRTTEAAIKSEGRSTRHTTIWSTIAAVIALIAVIYSVQQLAASYQQNLLAAFQTGLAAKPEKQ